MNKRRNLLLKTNIIFSLFFLLSLFCSNLSANNLSTVQLMEIKDKIYRFEFDSAQILIRDQLKSDPEDMSLNFYDAFVDFLGFSQDVTKWDLERNIEIKLKIVITVADSILDENPENIQALYHKALALGLKGLYHVVRHEYLDAYWYGGDGIDLLEEVVELDPQFTDAYFGLGLFHYYIDLMPGLVKFFAYILGYSGSREEGLREMDLVARQGTVFKVEAKFALGVVYYFVENDLSNGLSWFKKLEKDYPGNPLVNLMFGTYYRRLNDIKKAKQYTKTVLQPQKYSRFGSLLHGAYYNYAMCFYVENKLDSALLVFGEMDRAPTAKSVYFRSTMNYWRGYLHDLTGNSFKGKLYYELVLDSDITKRWYDYVKSYLDNPLSAFEIEAIKITNVMQLNGVEKAGEFLKDHASEVPQMNWREKGRYYFIKGKRLTKSRNYEAAIDSYRTAIESFSEIDFEPMVAQGNFEILKISLARDDLDTAEKAYDEAADYEERYFQIKLRKWWAELENRLDQE